jgi:uncharacterized membrane protein
MSTNKTDDAVTEYLREVEVRVGNLPLLQRRELLADLEAHIAAERAERNVQSEGEVLEILERLGSPEVVAAAAWEEAGTSGPAAPIPRIALTRLGGRRRYWPIVVVAAVVVVLVVVLCGALTFSRSSEPAVEQRQAPVQPVQSVQSSPTR